MQIAQAVFAVHAGGAGAVGPRQGRARARAWAIELTEGAAERRLPHSRCAREGSARTAMTRECDGRRLDLYAASGPDESEDRVVIRGPAEL